MMKTKALLFNAGGLKTVSDPQQIDPQKCGLVLGFGAKALLAGTDQFKLLRDMFPKADIALCSTAGEIFDTEVLDEALSVVAIEFEKTKTKSTSVNISDFNSSYEAGANLVSLLDKEDLKHILILSDGAKVNGSELVRGIESVIRHTIPVTGGLAGDGTLFNSTLVGLNAPASEGSIVAIAFYGSAIRVKHGSLGGWEMFGLEKTVTRSLANELFEIDHESALDLYKKYLGKYADGLPGSALLFPLSIILPGITQPIVRTILSINQQNNSMIFAGDVPQGSRVRFMKANFDKLIDAANGAAQQALHAENNGEPGLALLISCVGRKIILGSRIDEELEAVKEVLPAGTVLSGFYSYGEISPINDGTQCELHNQTMTITTFFENT